MRRPSPQTLLFILLSLMLTACSTNNHTAPDTNRSPDSAEDTASPDPDDSDQHDDANEANDVFETQEKPLESCAPFTTRARVGRLMSTEIDEASGLAASWNHEGLLWTHNDSGDTARLFLIRPGGSTVAEVQLTSVKKAVDWEDIAIAPCEVNNETDTEKACIYVADTGDNLKRRDQVVIYRFPEPVFAPEVLDKHTPESAPFQLNIDDADAIWLTYPEGPRDVETLLVHPQNAAIYLVEKNDTPDAPVFRVPNPGFGQSNSPETPVTATQVASLHHKGLDGLIAMLTGGDISPDGREFTVRTYLQAFTYCMPAQPDVADHAANDEPLTAEAFETAFSAPPVRSSLPILKQGESLTYDRNGHTIWITSEGEYAPIYSVTRTDTAIVE